MFPGDIPDDKFVMTTWHNDETLEDVVSFATFSANHSSVPLEKPVSRWRSWLFSILALAVARRRSRR